MKCPHDGELLSHKAVSQKFLADIHLDVCQSCQGVWVDREELELLITHFSSDHQQTYKNWLTATTSGLTAPKDFWQETERSCPKDTCSMHKHYLGAAHQVGVEQCPQCGGFWFDGSELHAVAKANEPNPEFDRAVAGALSGLRSELQDNYRQDRTVWWDFFDRPQSALPFVGNLLLDFMIAFLVRR